MGEANSGHYYSYINDRESDDPNDWFEFNDAVVIPFDIDELDDKAFGGETEIYFTDENGEKDHAKTEKSANAYMLVYERKQMYLWETINSNKEELIRIDEFGKLKEKVNIKQISQEENKDDEFPKVDITESTDLLDIEDPEKLELEQPYEIEIPKEFDRLIENINVKEWQLKYIFVGEMIDSISGFLKNIEIIRFMDYSYCKHFNLQADMRKQQKAMSMLGEEMVNNIELIKF